MMMEAEDGEQFICAQCGSAANQRCTGCHVTFYCSREHQKLHWKLHKSQCCAYKVSANILPFHMNKTWANRHLPSNEYQIFYQRQCQYSIWHRKQSSILKVVVNNCSVPGVQFTRAGEVSRGHQRPEAGRDDHIRDSSGHRTPSCHHPSVSGLLQTCYKQICVSSSVWLETIQLNISIFSKFLFQLSCQQITNIYGNFSLQKYINWSISFLSCSVYWK